MKGEKLSPMTMMNGGKRLKKGKKALYDLLTDR
jgi:hypothetical protein